MVRTVVAPSPKGIESGTRSALSLAHPVTPCSHVTPSILCSSMPISTSVPSVQRTGLDFLVGLVCVVIQEQPLAQLSWTESEEGSLLSRAGYELK